MNQDKMTLGQYANDNQKTIKEIAADNHMTAGKMMDLLGRKYDHNDPQYETEVKLRIDSNQSKKEKQTVKNVVKFNQNDLQYEEKVKSRIDQRKKDSQTVKNIVASNHTTLGDMMDMMNRDYDRDDPKFLKEVSLRIYDCAKRNGNPALSIQLRENMVMNPGTIGHPKESDCLQGIEQDLDVLDQVYSMGVEQKTGLRTR